MATVERIYIGGLDPSRLTAQEVASRLKTSVSGVEIQSTDLVGDDKNFFYINAVSNDTVSTALSKIAKQYNNVTWKRCKLIVQAARPHFLQRLAQERLQRQQQENLQPESRERRPIPRHLRIRQKFGAEAHQVDTKPCQTNEWSDFCNVVNKLRAKREQHNEALRLKKRCYTNEELLEKKRSFRNRAVHLRWTDESLSDDNGHPFLVNVSSDTSVNSEPHDALSTSENSETDDSESSTSIDKPIKNGKHSKYIWSDDEESESSVENALDDKGTNVSVDNNDESVSSESESEDHEKVPTHKADNEGVMPKESKEHKLLSETSGVDEGLDGTSFPSRSSPLSSRLVTEEFSAAIDFNDSPLSSGYDNTSVGESKEPLRFSADSQNLDNDVQSNLNVLSSLFPDMADMKPVTVDRDDNEDHGIAKYGWEGRPSSGLGLMQRFDPTKESAKKFIIAEPPKASTNSEVADEALPGRLPDSESKLNDDEAKSNESSSDESNNTYTKSNVYEQSRLEDIFRQAKSSGSGEAFKMSSMFDDKIEESDEPKVGESFAFGFDTGGDMATPSKPVQQEEGFAFSFNVDSKEQKEGSRVDVEGKTENKVAPTEDSDGNMQAGGEEPAGIQRRGLFFPEDTLDGYVNSFFAMNEGSRILEDPRGFLRDDGIKHRWKNERHALTLDWKRKKKYAQSRMQKKMRFR